MEIHGCSDPKVGAYRKQGREPLLNVGPTDTGIIRKNPLYAWRKSVNGLREMERRSTAQAQARSRMSWNGERLR